MTWSLPLLGGALIGGASALLLLTHGRIAGISGIAGGAIARGARDRAWRIAFLVGLVASGLVARAVAPAAVGSAGRPLGLVIVAGLLVGYGARMGGGCTSGHGVCGLGRSSTRSVVAVVTFVATGMLTVALVGGGS